MQFRIGVRMYRLCQLQWAPTRTFHDPNPPITLEDPPPPGGPAGGVWGRSVGWGSIA